MIDTFSKYRIFWITEYRQIFRYFSCVSDKYGTNFMYFFVSDCAFFICFVMCNSCVFHCAPICVFLSSFDIYNHIIYLYIGLSHRTDNIPNKLIICNFIIQEILCWINDILCAKLFQNINKMRVLLIWKGKFADSRGIQIWLNNHQSAKITIILFSLKKLCQLKLQLFYLW